MPMKPGKLPNKELVIKHLKQGKVNFTFKKADGELREANGTLIQRFVPTEKQKWDSNPNPPESNSDNVVYWDIDKNAWRSFKISKLEDYKGLVARL